VDGGVIHPECETGAACTDELAGVKAAFSEARDWKQLPVHDSDEYSTEVLSRKRIVGDAA
jgi:hypothetical protein